MSKNAIIFGATSGIGKELAHILVTNGYTVLITGRRIEKLNEIKATNPEKYHIVQHDVTKIDTSDDFFKKLPFESIDLIILSSGTGGANYKLAYEVGISTLETNVLGFTKLMQLSYNYFNNQGYGHLVGITSIASIRGNRHVPEYFASKAYQSNYLESLWMKAQRSKNKIVVTNILPGYIDTVMAEGNTFWMATLNKASKQIYSAIKKKKKKAYITNRWRLVAWILRIAPTCWLNK